MAGALGTPPSLPAPVRATGRLVLLTALVVFATTTGGSFATDVMSYEVTKGMVERRSVAMSHNVHGMDAHRGVDGQYYAPYGIGHALFGVPFYVAGRLAEQTLGLSIGRSDAITKAAFVSGSAVASALVVWIVYLFAWRLARDRRAAVLTALTVGFGTLLWPYSKFGFNAPFAALTVVGGVYGVWLGTASRQAAALWIGSLLLAFAMLVRHELAIATVVAALWVLGEERGRLWPVVRSWIVIGLPSAAAAAITLGYNQVRFGSIWDTGYLRDGTATFGSIAEGMVGLTLSPGRSVFLYSFIALPALVALAQMFRRDRSSAWLLAGVSAALFLFYASLTYWDADRSYGPRYLLPVLPLVCLPLVYWFHSATGWRRGLLAAATVASVVGQVPGVLVDFTKVGSVLPVGRIEIEDRRWRWDRAGIILNTQAVLVAVPLNAQYLTGAAEPPARKPPEGRARDFSEQFGYSLDFWWLYLYYMHVLPNAVALGVGAACIGFSVLLVGQIVRTPREP